MAYFFIFFALLRIGTYQLILKT